MRFRILLAFSLIIAVTLVGVAFLVRQGITRELQTFLYRGGAYGLEELVYDLEEYYETNGSWQGVEEILLGRGRENSRGLGAGRGSGQDELENSANRRNVRLLDASGRLIFAPDGVGIGEQLVIENLSDTIAIEWDNQTVGYLLPHSGLPWPAESLESALLARLNQASITAAIIAGGLSIFIALLLVSYLLQPVRTLTRAAEAMSAGDLSQRVHMDGAGELPTLGHAFDHMAESLEQAENRRRAMTADIAHELRTPLAVQRANLEALQDDIFPLTVENLAPVLEQNRLLTRLVNDLRTLSLAEAGELALHKSATNVSRLLVEVAEHFHPQALQGDIEIKTQTMENCSNVVIDPERLEQILINLLDNALRYTPKGGSVNLDLSCKSGSLNIAVHDSGPGIPDEALPYIFDRFYRVDHARSREEGGTGLGLAIARQLVEAHQGTISARNHPGGGAVFEVAFPLPLQST
jgi:signal transduction histidine kinase